MLFSIDAESYRFLVLNWKRIDADNLKLVFFVRVSNAFLTLNFVWSCWLLLLLSFCLSFTACANNTSVVIFSEEVEALLFSLLCVVISKLYEIYFHRVSYKLGRPCNSPHNLKFPKHRAHLVSFPKPVNFLFQLFCFWRKIIIFFSLFSFEIIFSSIFLSLSAYIA